jgi:hypothetical protein
LELADMAFWLMKNMAIDRGNMLFNGIISHLISEAFWKTWNTFRCNTIMQIMSKARVSHTRYQNQKESETRISATPAGKRGSPLASNYTY